MDLDSHAHGLRDGVRKFVLVPVLLLVLDSYSYSTLALARGSANAILRVPLR